MGFRCGSAGKESACNAGNLGSIPGLGRSPREGKSYLLQYSGLENSMDCIAYGVAKSQTWLSDFNSNVNIIYCTWKLTRGLCLILNWYKICCCCSVTKWCLTLQLHELQHTMLSALHCLLKFAQIHVHCVEDAIQPSHSLSPPSLPALNLPQNQSVSNESTFASSGQSARAQFQHQSFQ